MAESKGGIYLPEPEGYERSQITFKNGIAISVDCQVGELLDAVAQFLDGKERFLRLIDAQYGAAIYVSRLAIEEAMAIGVTWIKNLAPRPDSNGKIVLPSKYVGN